MVLLRQDADAARISGRARRVTPVTSHRVQRFIPVIDRETAVGRVMKRLDARELVPLHQPHVGAPARALDDSQSPLSELLGMPVGDAALTAAEQSLLSRLFLLRYDADDIDAPEAAALLNAADEVELAEPNLVMHVWAEDEPTFVVPDDSLTTVTAARRSEQWWLDSLRVTDLWQQKLIKNIRVKIAVIDTGVDMSHPDLQGNLSVEGYDFPRDTTDIIDPHGHGTHCAGIAAANGRGQVAGACPEALILPVTVMDKDGMGSLFGILQGVIYALNHSSQILSMSLGGYGKSALYEQIMAIAARRSIVFAAAGNDGVCFKADHRDLHGQAYPHQPSIPGAYPGVIAVMSTDQDGSLSYFSNFDCDGPLHSDSAKAANYELRVPGRRILSTLPDGEYGYMSGTSMATPLAAGAVARLCLSSRWDGVPHLLRTLIMTQDRMLNVMDALTASRDELEADAFEWRTDSVAYTCVRIDTSTVQIGDGRHPAVTILDPACTSLTLPDEVRGLAVTTLASHAFDGCTSLQTLRLGRALSSISADAVSGSTSLADIYVTTDVPPTCASSAFSSEQLRTVRLNIINGFTSPYNTAPVWRSFRQRHELDLVTGNRFTGFTQLYPTNSSVVPVELPTTCFIYNLESQIGQVGAGDLAIDARTSGRLTIPSTIHHSSFTLPPFRIAIIGDEAFYGCSHLTSVELPATVSYIDTRAFAGCTALTSLYLSSSLSHVSNYAFAECPNLRLIVAPMTTPPELPVNAFITMIAGWSSDADISRYSGVYDNARLIVPYGCRDLYADTPLSALFRESHHEELRQIIESWRPFLIEADTEGDALQLCTFHFDLARIRPATVYLDFAHLINHEALQSPMSVLAAYMFQHSNLSKSENALYVQLKRYKKLCE